ncbi:MAG: type II toxin-antitoxin system RelE/ParE family toxin [Candidatus Hydrothermarchaeales archaeon]
MINKFRVFTTREFDNDYDKLDRSEQKRVDKILEQLMQRGVEVGKPLAGLSFFREKKFGGKRLYFLVYRDVLIVLALGIGDKKVQQATINKILKNLAEYQQYVFKTLQERGFI